MKICVDSSTKVRKVSKMPAEVPCKGNVIRESHLRKQSPKILFLNLGREKRFWSSPICMSIWKSTTTHQLVAKHTEQIFKSILVKHEKFSQFSKIFFVYVESCGLKDRKSFSRSHKDKIFLPRVFFSSREENVRLDTHTELLILASTHLFWGWMLLT